MASIFVLGAFLAADSSIPRAFDHSILIIVVITLHVRHVERLHLHALHHLIHGFLVLLVEVYHASWGYLGWRERTGLHDLGLLDRQLVVLVVVADPGRVENLMLTDVTFVIVRIAWLLWGRLWLLPEHPALM